LNISIGHKILISPIGDFDPTIISEISGQIHRIFGYSTEVVPMLTDLSFAYHTGRKQYHSTPILVKLETFAPPEFLKILAITRVDLFIPILTYVFGEAQLGGKSCIVSTCRLNEDNWSVEPERLFKARIVKEAIHELGHTFNLRHCKSNDCIMNYCRGIEEVDLRTDQLCRYCKVLLADEEKRL